MISVKTKDRDKIEKFHKTLINMVEDYTKVVDEKSKSIDKAMAIGIHLALKNITEHHAKIFNLDKKKS